MMTEDLLRRVCGEFLEMPGMSLTAEQAQRLWGLDQDTCTEVLTFLVDARFLCQTNLRTYSRVTDGPAKMPFLQLSA